jgi:xylan 1,4-beta-xylosidase
MRLLFALASFAAVAAPGWAATWTADNGNGTFTNPLFYDEFSDPDLIRVGEDYYLTGTTMHAMPGLPVLHSRDLVNWRLLGYAFDRLDLGPEFRLEDGKEIYGQGIWAPCLRYHDGTFHIFTNINRHTTQHFQAANPAGPWTRVAMKQSLHDLSVLFDDDGKAYAVWGYQDIQFAQLNDDLTDIVPGTQRTLIPKSAGMGEGLHFYKINGRYYITSAWYMDRMRLACARADRREGPYEVNPDISSDEDFGLAQGNRMWKTAGPPFEVVPGNPASRGHLSLHQGGIVATPAGEWWGFSMMDANSVGRLTGLSPVTWQEGWPYFGLPGNLRRTPRTWLKPNTGSSSPPAAPYARDDEFAGPRLNAVWQWNHVPDDARWSLAERPGFLRLHTLAAPDFWRARNTLTQRAVGPQSTPTVVLETGGLQPGDMAGLALLNLPYAWIGVRCGPEGLTIDYYNQRTGQSDRRAFTGRRIWLRAQCDFLRESATFSYSADGRTFQPLGGEFELVFQLKTFQGVRYSLFAFNDAGAPGGYADFDAFSVAEAHPRGLMRPIPSGRAITLSVHAGGATLGWPGGALAAGPVDQAGRFAVVDCGLGRVALRADDGRWLTVTPAGGQARVTLAGGTPSPASTFQWMENFYGDLMLLSLATDRYLRVDPATGAITADHPGPAPDRRDGSCFDWNDHAP